MKTHVPNFNTFSTLLDRFSVEIVKRSHFEFLIETHPEDSLQLSQKIEIQNAIIDELKIRITDFLEDILQKSEYHYISEERTFS